MGEKGIYNQGSRRKTATNSGTGVWARLVACPPFPSQWVTKYFPNILSGPSRPQGWAPPPRPAWGQRTKARGGATPHPAQWGQGRRKEKQQRAGLSPSLQHPPLHPTGRNLKGRFGGTTMARERERRGGGRAAAGREGAWGCPPPTPQGTQKWGPRSALNRQGRSREGPPQPPAPTGADCEGQVVCWRRRKRKRVAGPSWHGGGAHVPSPPFLSFPFPTGLLGTQTTPPAPARLPKSRGAPPDLPGSR